MKQFAFVAEQVFTIGALQTMRGKNTHAVHLFVFTFATSEAPLLFMKVDGWDPHKIQIGKKMFLY